MREWKSYLINAYLFKKAMCEVMNVWMNTLLFIYFEEQAY